MVRKIHLAMARAILDFSRFGLKLFSDKYGGDCTINEARIMIQIVRCQLDDRTCSVTALHNVSGIPISTVSRAVANLQRDGWVSERPDPSDGRKRIISFGPRSRETTPGDIQRSIDWILNYRKTASLADAE